MYFFKLPHFGRMIPYLCSQKPINRDMEKTNLKDGLLAQMIEEEAWKNLSSDYPWSEALLEKFKDKVDWEAVSSNQDVAWTVSMLESFKNRINWYELSRSCSKSLFIPEIVEQFKDRWDWKELSGNSSLPIETIRKMADYIDWKALIDSRYRDDIFGLAFLREFEDRIPVSSLKDSRLWQKLVEEKEDKLRVAIALG